MSEPQTYQRVDPKKASLARLAGNFGKASLPDATWRAWEDFLNEYSDREVEDACQKIMKSSMEFFPKWAQFAAFLPARSASNGKAGKLPWWHVDGSWGGDWTSATKERISEVAREMIRCIGGPGDHLNAERRTDFLLMAVSRGAISQPEAALPVKVATAPVRELVARA